MANNKSRRPPKQNDELLKGAFEENFPDFLRFLYPNADEIFDFSKSIQFMDKELFAIVPDRERKQGKRVADLLAKVHLKDGTEKRILVHTEIEGGRQEDFAFRMFQYHYRLLDRKEGPVETIAVFTGDKNQPRPSEYRHRVIDTQIQFRYRAYHIFDHSEAELLTKNNVFALIVLACQKALLEDKVPEKELGEDRLTIAKTLLERKYEHERITRFIVFLKNFLYINDSEINRIFDEQIIQLSRGTIDMGVIEIVKKQERQLGLQKGLKEGLQKGRKEEATTIAREMKKDGLPVEQIAKFTKLSIKDIEKLK